ncbi:MAG: hypothetical protein JSS44_06545 [Proteobacteria bacterium]|nr:hypothetical protein [Pseudomonadota bacterium]MBS0463217.1 hypothetical protein [Pseudomonadota bacterium]MBS0464842.1 hypothetical protein [Pseudomonadota bacterium]
MTSNIENLLLEHLKRIQTELAAARERDIEIIARLGHLEAAIARIGRDQAGNYEELIGDRHVIDKLRERLERIERRLEIDSA